MGVGAGSVALVGIYSATVLTCKETRGGVKGGRHCVHCGPEKAKTSSGSSCHVLVDTGATCSIIPKYLDMVLVHQEGDLTYKSTVGMQEQQIWK